MTSTRFDAREGYSARVNQREVVRSKCIFKIVEIMDSFGSRFQFILS